MDIENFETLLKVYKYKSNMTSNEIAQKVGISPVSYSSYENGHSVPKIENLKKISDILNIPYLLALEKWRQKKEELKENEDNKQV